MGLLCTVAPTFEPLDFNEVKGHLRVDFADDDTDIVRMIQGAREYVENATGRQLCAATWKYTCANWPTKFYLPRPPLVSIAADGVKYLNSSGVQTTLAASQYVVDVSVEPGTVEPAYSVTWPAVRAQTNSVEVTYVAGYGAATAVPAAIKRAMLQLMRTWYDTGQAVITGVSVTPMPRSVEELLAPYCMPEFH